MAKRIIYRPTFLGIKTFVKGPLLKSKKAALSWILRNAHRVETDIEVYEVDLDKIKNKEKIVATRWTYMGAVHSAQSNNPLKTIMKSEHKKLKLSFKGIDSGLYPDELKKLEKLANA